MVKLTENELKLVNDLIDNNKSFKFNQNNPKRLGAYNRYELYKSSTNYKEFINADGKRDDFKNDYKKGFITLDNLSNLENNNLVNNNLENNNLENINLENNNLENINLENNNLENNNKYNFILGNCLEVLKEIPDKTISLIITSPPYNIGLKYNKYKDKKPREQYLEWIYDIFVELKRVLKDDGHIFLNMGYTNKDPWISMEVAMKLKDLFILQNKITWVKSVHINGVLNKNSDERVDKTFGHFKNINSERYINVTNEDLYHFTKNDKVTVNKKSVGVPFEYKCNLIDRKTGQHKIDKKTGQPMEDKRCKGNTWFIPYKTITSKKDKGEHPAIFPEELVEHFIKISDIKEGSVLDPFCGTGTTVNVAKKMNNLENSKYNLSGIGIDIDEKYINYCKERIKG